MSFFEKNYEILKQKFPGLLEELSTIDENNLSPEDIKIESAQNGEPVLCVKGIYVHSPRDPVREGQRLVQASDTSAGVVVILGFGLGYTAFSAVELRRPVVIVEKYRNLLLKAMEVRDFSGFLSKPGVIFVVGGQGGDELINALAIANDLISPDGDKPDPTVIRNKALTNLDENWYKSAEEKIRTWAMKDKVNTATQKRFGERWVRNLSRNMSAIRDYPGISFLSETAVSQDSLESVPVFLAAAGPSLDRTLPLLHEIHKRCITVAVDTSLRFFVKNGIQPDFVLAVDPQFWNSRHLDRCVCEKTVLIAESAVYPSVLNLPFKKIFLCGSLFPLGTFIEKQTDPKGRLGAGGSVATTAWDFARSLGGSNIWIAGLDLAFPELKTHFKGARFEERANSENSRFNTGETWIVRALRDGFPFKAQCVTGGQVLTDRRLSLYAAWFENQFNKYPQIKNYSLFQEGLSITGLHAASEKDFLLLPNRREEIDNRLEAVFKKTDDYFYESEQIKKRNERYQASVTSLVRGLENIKKAADEGETVTQQALKSKLNQMQQDKIVKELDKITRRITDSEVKEVAGFLFPSVEKENDSDPFRAYLKSSLKLFSSLAKAAGFNLEHLTGTAAHVA